MKPSPVQHLAGVSDKLRELEGGRDPHPAPGPALLPVRLQSQPLYPVILTMRWAPGPHTTTSCSSSCLATSRTLWPKGVIWSPLLL